jgi:hypothetical protein
MVDKTRMIGARNAKSVGVTTKQLQREQTITTMKERTQKHVTMKQEENRGDMVRNRMMTAMKGKNKNHNTKLKNAKMT